MRLLERGSKPDHLDSKGQFAADTCSMNTVVSVTPSAAAYVCNAQPTRHGRRQQWNLTAAAAAGRTLVHRAMHTASNLVPQLNAVALCCGHCASISCLPMARCLLACAHWQGRYSAQSRTATSCTAPDNAELNPLHLCTGGQCCGIPPALLPQPEHRAWLQQGQPPPWPA